MFGEPLIQLALRLFGVKQSSPDVNTCQHCNLMSTTQHNAGFLTFNACFYLLPSLYLTRRRDCLPSSFALFWKTKRKLNLLPVITKQAHDILVCHVQTAVTATQRELERSVYDGLRRTRDEDGDGKMSLKEFSNSLFFDLQDWPTASRDEHVEHPDWDAGATYFWYYICCIYVLMCFMQHLKHWYCQWVSASLVRMLK